MSIETTPQKQDKQEALCDILNDLMKCALIDEGADKKGEIRKYLEAFSSIYANQFRHHYGMISNFIYLLPVTEFDTLTYNLSAIQRELDTYPDSSEFEPLKRGFEKLVDHVNLEISRIAYISKYPDEIRTRLNTFDSQTKKLETSYNDLACSIDNNSERFSKEINDEVNAMEEKISGFHTQSITLLSIFTAVVFAFSGGFTLLGSAIQSISTAASTNLYFLSVAIVFICMFLSDIIYALFYFSIKLTGKQITMGCQENCEKCSGKNPCKHLVQKLWSKHPFIIWSNIVLIALLIIVLMSLYFLT